MVRAGRRGIRSSCDPLIHLYGTRYVCTCVAVRPSRIGVETRAERRAFDISRVFLACFRPRRKLCCRGCVRCCIAAVRFLMKSLYYLLEKKVWAISMTVNKTNALCSKKENFRLQEPNVSHKNQEFYHFQLKRVCFVHCRVNSTKHFFSRALLHNVAQRVN